MDDLLKKFEETVETKLMQGISEFNTDAIARQLVNDLAEKKNAAIMTLLGIKHTFGKWEVDTHNKNSPIINIMATGAEPMVREWVESATKKALAELKKNEYEDKFSKAIHRYLTDNIEWRINREASRIVEMLVEEAVNVKVQEMRAKIGLPPRALTKER